jgi:hypothetical protein
MPAGRPTKLTPAVQKQIAELFFLAFTDEQVALMVGINERTIRRYRSGEFCPAIRKAEIAREMKYRQRVWDGVGNWCGASWFLERKYPTQFAKPEVQLQINTGNVTNNTLIVTAEVAHQMGDRIKEADAKVTQLFKRKELGNGSSSSKATK